MERDGQRTRAGRPPDAAAAGAGVPLLAGLDPALRTALRAIAGAVRAAGGRALVAGGAVRDARFGLAANDLDVEVFGLDLAALELVAGGVAATQRAGAAFEVLLVKGLPLELVLPHREDGGVGVPPDPAGTYAEAIAAAAARRDFTCNALYFDPLSGELLDPHGGCADCAAGRLRHTSARFTEDPLRVLRGMQLIARFELTPAPETVALCRTLSPAGLAPERVFEEWRKLLLHGIAIGRGLDFLAATGWLAHFPELRALADTAAAADESPAGDLLTRTGRSLDAFARERTGDAREDLVVGLAVLCHDLGAPAPASDGAAGATATRSFLGRMTRETALLDEVVPLVRELPRLLAVAPAPDDAAIRRLARDAGRLDRLLRVARAVLAGRSPRPFAGFPEGDRLLARARELGVDRAPPAPLVRGRDLLALGLSPGPEMGRLLAALYERQLDGEITTLEEGLAHARRERPA